MRAFQIFLGFLVSVVFSVPANADPIAGVGTGELMLKLDSGHETAVRLGTEVVFDVTGMVAHVKLKQRFRNPSNDFIEGVYVFPLPEQAAVNRMEILVGERKIVGEIKEKSEAKKIYESARLDGKVASLVAQSRPNLFRNRIANIPPQGIVEIELSLVQPVTYDSGSFSLRFPLAITPRYSPGIPLHQKVDFREGWGMPTDKVSDAHLISPWQGSSALHELKISGAVKMGMPLVNLGSPSHSLRSTIDGDVFRFELVQGGVKHRDFELNWRPRPGLAPRAAYFSETVDGEDFGYLMLLPPDVATDDAERLPREITFIVDTSGSMGGTSIEQAKQSLLFSLAQLSSIDTFNIIEFNSTRRALFAEAQPVTQFALFQAQVFVAGLEAGGGTEMLPALQFALSRLPSERLRQIVFITDGAVGNEAELLELIFSSLDDARLFTVGIGSAPNGYFMRTAAEFGRGSYTNVNSLDEVSEVMSRLFEKLSKPVVRDIEVDWPAGWQVFPEYAADLYDGEPLLIAVKQSGVSDQLTIRGITASQPWQQMLDINSAATGSGVATLWARSKLKHILEQKHRGVPESDIRPEALQLALTHNILSPYTSFVAVEEYITRPIGNPLVKQPVLSPMPDGQTLQMRIPQTNTGWMLWVLLGFALVLVSMFGIRFS